MPIPLGILAAGAAGGPSSPYWFTYGTAASSFRGLTDNFEITSEYTNASNAAVLITKLNQANGSIDWQRYIQNTTGDIRVYETTGLVNDGTNIFGLFQDESTGNSDFVVVKLNSTPSIVAQRRLGTAINVKSLPFGNLALDSSSNVYVSGFEESSPYKALISKWDSSLSYQWTRQITVSGFNHFDTKVTTDASNNVIASSQRNPTASGVTGNHIVKWNSSGTVQWQRLITAGEDLPLPAVTTDASSNIYTTYREQVTYGCGITKINSSGSKQWEKTLFRSGDFHDSTGNITLGPDGNIYMIHSVYDQDYAKTVATIVSITNGGSLNWHTVISIESNGQIRDTYGHNINFDSNGNIIVVGRWFDSIRRGYAATIKADGTTLGTFTDGFATVTLEAGARTFGTTSFTFSTPTDTVTGPSVTEASSSLSLGTSTLPVETLELG